MDTRAHPAAAILGRTQLLGGLRQDALDRVARSVVSRAYRRGEIVFHEGDLGDCLYVVARGLAKVYLSSHEGDEMVLATLCPPDTFGELAIIDGGRRTASARAIQDTTLLALRREAFLQLVRHEPPVAEALYRSMGTMLRRTLEQAADLVFLDLPGRVAKLLITLAEKEGEDAADRSVVHLDVGQADLARMVGGSRPSVNQILRLFESRGYVELERRRITLRRPDALRHRAGL